MHDRLTHQKSEDYLWLVFPWQTALDAREEKLRELEDKKNMMRKRCRSSSVVLIIDSDWIIICF